MTTCFGNVKFKKQIFIKHHFKLTWRKNKHTAAITECSSGVEKVLKVVDF